MPPRLAARGVAIALAAWLAAVASVPERAHADPQEQLEKARLAVRHENWREAIPYLMPLIYPDHQIFNQDDLIDVHLMLGMSQFMLGNTEAADREFKQVLFYRPDLVIPSFAYPPEAIAYFDKKKVEYAELTRKLREEDRRHRERKRLQQILDTMVIVEKHPFYINFLPLGAGQFQNGHKAKGTAFLVSELILGGASLGMWAWQVTKFGIGGDVPTDEVRTVQRVQQLQIATGSAALVLMAWGVIDALWYYRPTRRLAPDPAFLPEKLRQRLERLLAPEDPQRGPQAGTFPSPRGAGVAPALVGDRASPGVMVWLSF